MTARKNIDPRYQPQSWYPVLRVRLHPEDPGWALGFRCAVEQADGEKFLFRSAGQRDAFCRTHQLQSVDMAMMAAIREDFGFDLTQPWQPGNKLHRRPCVAITQRIVQRRRGGKLIRRRELRTRQPVILPPTWRALLAMTTLRDSQGDIAPQWDPIITHDDPALHAIDPRPYRRDERTADHVADDLLIRAILTSDHNRYGLAFHVLQKRSFVDPDFATAELIASTPTRATWPTRVELDLGGIEVMIISITADGRAF